ncbi:acyl-CoA dehydrogenase family protein [Umezawaea endophytica]|uniref:Acyl-CoA/acyl-ACP dehydrogenase n=1 Tax=Umezawaea endophytica TaxID=1654476 RepID=A0A9X2VPR9_9PSEU|nr:acyl-CoA dehydrogenase family protein [Umezawaea endophytica]MCS7480606.1 acyl-CoA/acyl-ACP dehydrogenase [Umezawaea endophytica]
MTTERLALRDSVRALLAKHSDVRAAMVSPGGYDTDLWARLCGDIGVAGLAIPEVYGGLGAGLAEAHVVLEELGRTLTPAPLLGSAVVAAQALLATGDERACHRWLPGIADGTTIAALAWAGADGRWDPDDVAVTASDTLDGTAHYVLDGDLADVLLVAARAFDGTTLWEVDPAQDGVAREHVPTMDPTRRLATVTLTGAVGRRLGPAALPHVRDVACAALSAEQVGTAARCLELTVEHTSTRVQFGRPIGTFQALKHRMADLHVLVETARSASGAADDPVSTAVAKVHCSEALCRVAAEMVQLHGGIAITWEHDAHLYFKRAHGSALLFGGPAEHVRRLAGQVF